MAVFAIPITNDPGVSYDIALRGIKYNFRFLWNDVDKAWYLDIYRDSALLIGSIRLVYGIDLLRGFQNIFPGKMALSSTRELGADRLDRDTPKEQVDANLFLLYDDLL
jgi:hypothetical protein